MSETRTFDLADALTVTSGLLLSHKHMDGVYEILDFMEGVPHFTHQLLGASERMAPELVTQHPWLADVTPPRNVDTADLFAWLSAVETEHGKTIEIHAVDSTARLMTASENLRLAMDEMQSMAGEKPIIAVHVDEP